MTLRLLIWGGHTYWCSVVTPGSAFRNQSWQAWGAVWNAWDRTKSATWKANALPGVLLLQP